LPDDQPAAPDPIATYRQALEKRNIARRTLGLFILFVVVVFLYTY